MPCCYPGAERDSYLPKGETQFTGKADFQDCANPWQVNAFEALLTYHYRHGMKPDNKKWCDDIGFVVWRDSLP